jgi:predicted ArsR family transcriptional regulator
MSPYERHTPPGAEAALQELTLALAEYLRRTAETAKDLLLAIKACLDSGATWGEVGKRLGMSKQAARAHWGPYLDQMIAEQAREERAAGAGPEPAGPERG